MSYNLLNRYGYATIYELDQALHGGVASVIGKSGMDIDADGAPTAYAPPGSGLPALDILADGGWPAQWYGGPVRNGKWVVQGPDDPAPGYIVSGTAWINPDEAVSLFSQRRYVDALMVPYWVRPRNQGQIQHGQVGIAFYQHISIGFVVADTGPHTHYGEGSVNLAVKLGINPSAISGGVSNGVFSLIFTDARIKWGDWSNIAPIANEQFEKWGGVPKYQEVIATIWQV